VRMAVWTLGTRPPDLAIAARPDENVAKVHVELFVPLFLQLISKQAGVESRCPFCSCCLHMLSLLLLMPEAVSAVQNASVKSQHASRIKR